MNHISYYIIISRGLYIDIIIHIHIHIYIICFCFLIWARSQSPAWSAVAGAASAAGASTRGLGVPSQKEQPSDHDDYSQQAQQTSEKMGLLYLKVHPMTSLSQAAFASGGFGALRTGASTRAAPPVAGGFPAELLGFFVRVMSLKGDLCFFHCSS